MKKQKKVAVVGLGYVGLPLAVLAREKGWEVVGLDIDRNKVDKINGQEVPFKDDDLGKYLKRSPIVATTDASVVRDVSIVVIAVPTPVDEYNHPDLTPLTSALGSIKPYLHAGQVVVVESTINPGVMDEVVMPLLSDIPGIHLAHCPERINPGDPKWSVRNIPRVLGGYSPAGISQALKFYKSVIEAPIKVMKSAKEAEAVKIMENTFRDVNIAFINEMAKSFAILDIDIINVIAGAATKPFAFMPHYPGNGVGGHCISVDPYYMIERAKEAGFDHQFLRLARRINESMPQYTVGLLEKGLKEVGLDIKTCTIALLGLSYKRNVADLRNSPSLKILEILKSKGATVSVFDPFVPKKSNVNSLDEAVRDSQAVILSCDHSVLVKKLSPAYLRKADIKIVVDGKNALNMEGITKAGMTYYGIGRSQKADASS